MKKRTLFLTALVLLLVFCAGAGECWAYFTTYAQAKGALPIRLGGRTDLDEDFSDWTKRLVITNQEGGEPVYVRAKAFGPERYPLQYSGEGWTPGPGGYYYCSQPVPAGGVSAQLDIRVTGIPEAEAPEDGETFNVVVIYESIPVPYRADGQPVPCTEADWSEKLDSVWEGGAAA